MEGNRRKRGRNYTQAEREVFLKLVKKYADIIDNKETNAHMAMKKKTAWCEITEQFNAVTTSEPREWTQLRHLYENMKQRPHQKQNTTCGIRESGIHVQAVSCHAMKPSPNTYSDTTTNYGDIVEKEIKQETYIEIDNHNTDNQYICDPLNVDGVLHKNPPIEPCTIQPVKRESKTPTKKGNTRFREQYFKLKLNNAKLERKLLLQRHKMAMIKFKLEVEILNYKIKQFRSRSINRFLRSELSNLF